MINKEWIYEFASIGEDIATDIQNWLEDGSHAMVLEDDTILKLKSAIECLEKFAEGWM